MNINIFESIKQLNQAKQDQRDHTRCNLPIHTDNPNHQPLVASDIPHFCRGTSCDRYDDGYCFHLEKNGVYRPVKIMRSCPRSNDLESHIQANT
jgi:hypothetical protein